MSIDEHSALISFSLDLFGGKEKGSKILHDLTEYGDISSISSIYKRYMSADFNDPTAKIQFVIRFDTTLDVDQTLQLILSLGDRADWGFKNKTSLDITLLTFDNMILMSPRLTLPYPTLHQDSLIIRCAAEAWGQYQHPIYQKTLNEISKNALPTKQAEFFMQGKSLIDF